MRERAAQELSPKMGRMGAEDPSRGSGRDLWITSVSGERPNQQTAHRGRLAIGGRSSGQLFDSAREGDLDRL